MAGDSETGIGIMKMDAGLDTGPVAMEERVAIAPDMTAGELHDQLMAIGADLMQRAMAAPGAGFADPDTATGRGHRLRRQDQQGGNPHRFFSAGR